MTSYSNLLLTPAEMREIDSAAIASGIPGVALMDAAGLAVAQAVAQRWEPRSVVVLCGLGNNGGDGFVAARYLREWGWPVRLALLHDTSATTELPVLSADAAHHARLWGHDFASAYEVPIHAGDLVIDALFGTGLVRPLQGRVRALLEKVATLGCEVCAVDLPSGVDGRTGEVLGYAAPARLTVTFCRKKTGHVLLPGRDLCGELVVADIGIPEAVLQAQLAARLWENHPGLWWPAWPRAQTQGHKYSRGHVLISGGAHMTGAARLAALAAQRAGAGLVTVAAPLAVWAIYETALTSAMVVPLAEPDDFSALLADARHNTILLGPGGGVGAHMQAQVLAALATGRPVLLDADALTSFQHEPERLFAAIRGPCVLTPHQGEFDRVFPGSGDKLSRARDAAQQSGAVVVLKGSDTVIAAPDGRACVNTNAPATLATGGTGDVLAGMITGLLAQGMAPWVAAAGAVWLHGAAAASYGPGLVADDLPHLLPAVLRSLDEFRPGSGG